jgi:hypothetical protein
MSANSMAMHYRVSLAFALTISISLVGLGQSGGQFTIQQSVIANGGGASSSGIFTVSGTSGQSVAGVHSTGGSTAADGGFWNAAPVVTTAATVSVAGRVSTASGQGIRNVRIVATLPDGTKRTCLTEAFGYYLLQDIESGQTLVITANSRRRSFAQPAIVVQLFDAVNNADFVSNEP